jgi:hypothetical protein
MTRMHLVDQAQQTRALVAQAARAHRIDALAPDRREAVLAAERYLRDASAYGTAAEELLARWRRGAPGLAWMSWQWVKSLK